MSRCGNLLDDCRCGGFPSAPRTAAQLNALHREAVRRAHASGFASQPVPGWVVAVLWPSAWSVAESTAA